MSLVKSASTPHLRGILERNPSSSSITDAPAPPLPRPQMTRSVSFAPLPDINKKKKKGSRPPLGIASRGAIIRKRMRHYDSPFPDDYPNSNGTIITLQGADGAAGEHLEKLRQLRSPDSGLGHPDPVVEFGRIVKEAGRNFWRKLSTSDSSHAITPSNGQPEPEGDSANHPQACIAAAKCEVVMEPRIQVVGPDPADDLYLHSENRVEGGVWEEEVGERYQRPYSTEKTLPPPPPRAYSPDSSVTTSPSQASDCSSAVSIPESPASEIDDTPHLPRFPMIEDPSLSLLTKEAASTQPLVSDVHHEQIHKLSIPVNP